LRFILPNVCDSYKFNISQLLLWTHSLIQVSHLLRNSEIIFSSILFNGMKWWFKVLYCISIYSYSITILNRLYSKYLMFYFLNDIEIAYLEIYLKIFDASLLLINKWKYSYGLVRHWLCLQACITMYMSLNSTSKI
jgi:hypothetical protein